MYVALRRAETGCRDACSRNDPALNWLRGTYRFRHAQIVLSVLCTPAIGRGTCSLCTAATKRSHHTLSFTAEVEHGVRMLVDVAYRRAAWELWSVPCGEQTLRLLETWLRAQVRAPFNASAYWWNACWAPWVCWVPAGLRGRLARGTQDGRDVTEVRPWFCTELCIAALQRTGCLEDESACGTAPDRLADLLRAVEGAQRLEQV